MTMIFLIFSEIVWLYLGPDKNKRRMVVMGNEVKKSVLFRCHINPMSGVHHGTTITQKRVEKQYYWIGITKDVDSYVSIVFFNYFKTVITMKCC